MENLLSQPHLPSTLPEPAMASNQDPPLESTDSMSTQLDALTRATQVKQVANATTKLFELQNAKLDLLASQMALLLERTQPPRPEGVPVPSIEMSTPSTRRDHSLGLPPLDVPFPPPSHSPPNTHTTTFTPPTTHPLRQFLENLLLP